MNEPLGLASRTVRVESYDARWPAPFRAEAVRVSNAIEAAKLPAVAIEHIGSTAVPGLAAKPILDLAIGRRNQSSAGAYISVLEAAGYVYRGDGGLPGREFFRRGELRTHHVHLVEIGGWHWQRYLGFRDALRADPELREAYASLKRALAAEHPHDREAYIQGKTAFVEAVVRSRGIKPDNAAVDPP
jgi:GrpB-like predicted nucleotidyltransferase (UPF0157 family)